MFAQSNTYITGGKRKPHCFSVLFLLLVYVSNYAIAQNRITIRPLQKTPLTGFQYDLYAYASRGSNKALTIVTPNNQFNMNMNSKSTHANIGLNGYINLKNYMGANIGISYTHERIAQDYGLFGDKGVYANWLNADFNLSILCFSFGTCLDFFLGSHVVNNDSFSYEGINDQCFNNFAYCTYASLFSTFRGFKIEIRYGAYLRPRINPDKIAYYNFLTSYVDSDYFEIRIYYRIFTSGNRIKSPERILRIKGQSK